MVCVCLEPQAVELQRNLVEKRKAEDGVISLTGQKKKKSNPPAKGNFKGLIPGGDGSKHDPLALDLGGQEYMHAYKPNYDDKSDRVDGQIKYWDDMSKNETDPAKKKEHENMLEVARMLKTQLMASVHRQIDTNLSVEEQAKLLGEALFKL